MASEGKERLREVVAQLRRLQSSIGRDIYEMGRLLFESRRDELHLVAGHRTFARWVEADLDLAMTTAYRAIDVYEHYSPTIAARYGPDKLAAGVAWIRATPEDERPGDLVAARLRLRGDGGRFVHKRFHEAKAVEVWDAVSLLEDAKRGRSRIPRTLRAAALSFAAKLPPGPRGVRPDSRVRLRRDPRTGALFVTFTAIPLGALDDFAGLVRAFRDTLPDER